MLRVGARFSPSSQRGEGSVRAHEAENCAFQVTYYHKLRFTVLHAGSEFMGMLNLEAGGFLRFACHDEVIQASQEICMMTAPKLHLSALVRRFSLKIFLVSVPSRGAENGAYCPDGH